MLYIKHSLLTVIFIVVFDLIWLTLQKPMYNSMVKKIQGTDISMRLVSGILAYVIMFIGLLYIIYPIIAKENNIARNITTPNYILAFKTAAIFGFVVYGIYNTTNYAIFKDYSLVVSIKDTLWGTFVFFISTWLTLQILGKV